jgi:antitoxin component YwqK of YwqJK toxin-antitoxin module
MPRRARKFWIGVVLVLGALALWLFYLGPKNAPAPREVPRQALELVDGRLCLTGAPQPFSGLMVERWENGALKSRSALAHGLLEGLSEGWHTNGQVQVRESFHAGVSHGLRAKWFASGRKESEGMIVNGKHSGLFRRWHEDGSLAQEIQMSEGNPQGLARAYYPSGFVKAEVRLRAGQVLERKFWKDGEHKAPRLAPN